MFLIISLTTGRFRLYNNSISSNGKNQHNIKIIILVK